MRVDPKRHGTWRPRGKEGPTCTVPGIVLSREQIIMRTDGVLAESLLGEGEALDSYSQGLQEATIGAKQAANAREMLAQRIVETKDTEMAALYVKLFPPPAVPIVVGGGVVNGNGTSPTP